MNRWLVVVSQSTVQKHPFLITAAVQRQCFHEEGLFHGAACFREAGSIAQRGLYSCHIPKLSTNPEVPSSKWFTHWTSRWCPIFPKWDSYQPLTNCRSLLVTRSLCHSACLSAGCHAPCVIPTYSNCSSLRDDPINWELASKTILQNPTSLSMQSHAVPYVSDFGALVDPWHWALSYACFVSPSHPHPWCPKGTSFPSNWRLCFALWVMFNLDRGTDCRMTTIINLL